jgi:hypothetical protein
MAFPARSALEEEATAAEERNMTNRFITLGAAMLMAVSISMAQTNPPAPGEVGARKQIQQDRIANGIQSGQLTAGETRNLEHREANLNRNERQMRAEDGGHLTAADHARLNQQENHISNKIYQDKHNDRVAHYGNGEIGQRRENQQDRIAQGIRSGQMTPGEASRQEGREQGLTREIAGMRQENGGRLSPSERNLVNHQQNQQSRQIYREKHNAKTGY